MMQQQVEKIAGWLAGVINDPELRLWPGRPVEMALNGRPVSVVWAPEEETLMAAVVIDDLTDKSPESISRIIRSAMENNYQWRGTDGGTIGLSDDGLLMLQRRWLLPAASEGEVTEAITLMVLAAEDWKKEFAGFEPAAGLPENALRI
jgi:hypothetical protein